jgi:putative membrane protein
VNAASLRLALVAAGLLAVALAFADLANPSASMIAYTADLMVLNQLAPPLLLAGAGRSLPRLPLAALLLDPLVALMVFGGLSTAVSAPQLLGRSLANALFSLPLGLLELIAGLLFWAQLFPATRQVRSPLWLALLVTLGNIPMTAVSVIWMTSGSVLYAPYLNILCRWNLTPLQDQHYAGFVMFLAGFPLQVMAIWHLVAARPELRRTP